MLLLVGQILAVNADDLAALVAVVGKHILVALDAVRVVIARGKTWYLLTSIFLSEMILPFRNNSCF